MIFTFRNYFVSGLTLVFCSFSMTCLYAGQPIATIKSPDGYYVVSASSVSQIKTIGVFKGDYEYHANVIEVKNTKFSKFEIGELVEQGYWVPSSQQFYLQRWKKTGSGHKCDAWSDPIWSPQYAPKWIRISGNKVQVWKQGYIYPSNRKAEPICVDAQISSRTCKMQSCFKWSNPDISSDMYIVKNRDDALTLHSSIYWK